MTDTTTAPEVADTTTSEDSPESSLAEFLKRMRGMVHGAHLRKALLEQRKYWVPADAWKEYNRASFDRWGFREPNFTVEGVLKVKDMDADYRARVVEFLWRQSAGICSALSWDVTLFPGNDDDGIMGDRFAESESWERLSHSESKRRAWFDEQPLIKALRDPKPTKGRKAGKGRRGAKPSKASKASA